MGGINKYFIMNQEDKNKDIQDDDLFADDDNVFHEDDELFASDQPITSSAKKDEGINFHQEDSWEIMIIDDEEDVHQLTCFVLDDYVYQGKELKFISAYSAKEAKVLLEQHPSIAIILLDVVMETSDAGLKLVKYIREQLQNRFVRIILRTGQPGYAPEKQVILKYDINDYKNKTELTDQKLFTVITASLRAYSDIMTIESYRRHLEEKVVERTHELREKNETLSNLNQQLVQLNQDKNEFLGIAAHDLKNPLSTIQSLANLIRTSFEDFSRQKLTEFASMIEVSAQNMFSLIKNLLDVNAIESGNMNLSSRSLNMLPFLQGVVNNYLEPAKAKEITLQFQFTEEDYYIFVDENAIFQVLDNLISNAVKYSPQSKTVYIRIIKGKMVRCEIQDEGPGLSEKEHGQLFQKFVRLSPRPTGDEHSTGLGLFIVKKLVDIMNGTVWCESILGKGTTFILEFPLASPNQGMY
jgi:signal transduction histidine kinase